MTIIASSSSTATEVGAARAGEARLLDASTARCGALRRYRQIAVELALTDAVCVVAALVASYALRYPSQLMPARDVVVIAVSPLVWVLVFATFHLYAPLHLSAHEELRRVIGASGVGTVLLALVSFWSKSQFSRLWVGLTWVLVLILELLMRRWWRAYLWRLRKDGRLALRTLVVGASPEAGSSWSSSRAPARGSCRSGYAAPSIRATPRTGYRCWAGGRARPPRPRARRRLPVRRASTGSPTPTCPGSLRWHARRRSR